MIRLRPLTSDDLDLVCYHRAQMFREAGTSDAVITTMSMGFRSWLEPRILDGRYFGFVAEADQSPVGGIGLMEIDWPPHPSHPLLDKRGYVLNVYVSPKHRGQRIATRLMGTAEQVFAERGISFAILHATDAGRPLYDRIGWVGTCEMAKLIVPAPPS